MVKGSSEAALRHEKYVIAGYIISSQEGLRHRRIEREVTVWNGVEEFLKVMSLLKQAF